MFKRIALPIFVLMLISGCQGDILTTIVPKNVEQTIKNSLVSSQSENTINDFQLLSTYNKGGGILTVYRYTSQRNIGDNFNSVDTHNIGLAFVKQIHNEWVIDTGKSSGTDRVPQHIIYDTVDIENESITFGQIFDNDAASITIIYNDGTISTKAVDTQTFLMNAPVGATVKELRIFDNNGMIYSCKDKGNKFSD